jgi:hypothetical protein
MSDKEKQAANLLYEISMKIGVARPLKPDFENEDPKGWVNVLAWEEQASQALYDLLMAERRKSQRLQAENAELKKQSQWISVDDAHPKYGQKCNVYLNGALMDGVYMFDGADDCDDWFEPITENKSNGFFVFENKIKWCALPTPPEVE